MVSIYRTSVFWKKSHLKDYCRYFKVWLLQDGCVIERLCYGYIRVCVVLLIWIEFWILEVTGEFEYNYAVCCHSISKCGCYLRLKLFVYAPEPFRSVYIRKDNCGSRHIYKSCDITVAFIFLNWLYMNFIRNLLEYVII